MNKGSKYLNIIFISNDWEKYHRKAFTENLIINLSQWSDILLVQLPVSLIVHLFSNFKKKILGLFKGNYSNSNITDDAILFTPIIIFHYLLWKNKLIFRIDNLLLNFQLNRFIKKGYLKRKTILWYYFPFLLNYVIKSNAIMKIYDQYDIYHMDIKGNIDKNLESMNNELIKISDVVFCTSEYLYNLSKNINCNSYYITNGNDYELLAGNKVNKATINLPMKNAKTIGYLGGIRDWIDFELLKYVIKEREDINFLFIGGIYKNAEKEMEELIKNKNVLWINYVNQKALPEYLSLFDVGIIPFKTTEFFKSVFPNKFFEYLASGIPVVSTNLIELEKYKNIIGYSKDANNFLNNCDLALSGYFNKYLEDYSLLAKDNSWYQKTKNISSIIKEKLKIN